MNSLITLSKALFIQLLSVARRHWMLTALAALLLAVSTWSVPAWAGPVAAPLNQTVPRATPTPPFNDVVPTATPRPADESEPGSNGQQPGSNGQTSSPGIDDTAADPDSVPFTLPPGLGGVGPAVGAEALTAVVGVGTLNVREGPGTAFSVIGTMNLGYSVTVEARNQENTWWYVCCLPNTETRGWVSAALLQPNFDPAQAAQLIPVFGQAQAAQTQQTQPAATPTPAAVTATLPVSLTVSQNPAYVWQGKTFDIELTVVNPNDVALRNLEISDEIGNGLTFVEAGGEGAPNIIERATPDGTLVIFRWSTIPADAIVQARITVTVDADLPAGSVLDNLAAARATNGQYTTGGITIGLPPASIPDFQ